MNKAAPTATIKRVCERSGAVVNGDAALDGVTNATPDDRRLYRGVI
jgi:hypothetical protein